KRSMAFKRMLSLSFERVVQLLYEKHVFDPPGRSEGPSQRIVRAGCRPHLAAFATRASIAKGCSKCRIQPGMKFRRQELPTAPAIVRGQLLLLKTVIQLLVVDGQANEHLVSHRDWRDIDLGP